MKMINRYYYILTMFTIIMSSCKKDNYDPPESQFRGRVVYNGEALNVEHDQVFFQLWQPGFGKLAPINVAVAQDGTYSSLLFNGNYKLVFGGGLGPFMSKTVSTAAKDTIFVNINGNQTLDIEVTPYYMIRNPSISANGRTLSASISLEKIITDANAKNIERVTLYVNKTQFVSGNANSNIASDDGDISNLNNIVMRLDVPNITPTQNYVFARVGVKIEGVPDLIFSPLQKIQL